MKGKFGGGLGALPLGGAVPGLWRLPGRAGRGRVRRATWTRGRMAWPGLAPAPPASKPGVPLAFGVRPGLGGGPTAGAWRWGDVLGC